VVGALVGVLWGWAAMVAVVSGVAIFRRARAPRIDAGDCPPLILVRPCAGAEPGLLARLSAVGDWPRPPQVRLSVTDAHDPAHAVAISAVAALCAQQVDAEVRVILAVTPNLKSAQLIHWFDAAPPDAIFINVDSDVDLDGFDGAGLIGALRDADAAWTPPSEHQPLSFGDHASAAFLNASLHSFALLGGLDPAGLVGKVFAVRVGAMRAAGGFDRLDTCLGEDMEIARRIRANGGRVALHPGVARACPQGRNFADVVGRYARWLAVIRAQRPALLLSYPLLFGATLPLIVLSMAAGAWGALGLAVGARAGVVIAARHFNARPLAPLSVLPAIVLGEIVTWGAFLRASTTRSVIWRGRRLRIGLDGQLDAQTNDQSDQSDQSP
jgi:ceramide glucosyltransferase